MCREFDMHKGYDNMEWFFFLENMMRKLGSEKRGFDLMMACGD
jgi:hypothetical protein